jgi:hypothetical protein
MNGREAESVGIAILDWFMFPNFIVNFTEEEIRKVRAYEALAYAPPPCSMQRSIEMRHVIDVK